MKKKYKKFLFIEIVMVLFTQATFAQNTIKTDTTIYSANSQIDETVDPEWWELHSKMKRFNTFSPSLTHNEGAVDTNLQKELVRIRRKYKDIQFTQPDNDTSSFVYLKLASHYTNLQDSISVSYCLNKVNPYHIRSILDLTGVKLDSFLSRFVVKDTIKLLITKQQYDLQPRSLVYDTFRNFYFKIDSLRKVLDTIESNKKKETETVLSKTDSLQLKFLRTYTSNYGWPSLADGSIFAGQLAKRDIRYYYTYLEPLKRAFNSGQVSQSIVNDILENQYYLYNYTIVEESEKYYYKKYDVTVFKDMYESKFLFDPEYSDWIFKEIDKNCEELIDFFFVYYANNLFNAGKKSDIAFGKDKTECYRLATEIDKICPEFGMSKRHHYGRHLFLPNYNYLSDKEFFYIVFKKD